MGAPARKTNRDSRIVRMIKDHPNWTKTQVAAKFHISTTRLYNILRRYRKTHNT